MKKNILAFCLLLSTCFNCFSQKITETYHSNYWDKDYDIIISPTSDNSDIKNLSIEVEGKGFKDVELMFDGPQIDDLQNSLIQVKEKYSEWTNVAKQNNVTDMSKEIPVSIPRFTVAFYGSKWYFHFKTISKFYFKILSSGTMAIILSEKVTASSNEYIDETFYWVFESPEEMSSFINKIDKNNLLKKIKEESNKSDLFK
ncbi:MAG: hypothetical protein E7070_06965 [Bacteroidales bacterium]|nr:hypothetical protein [Bacteroidales bacterium]